MALGDCDRGYGIPSYPACSGHGICVSATNKCICNKGWSSLADFHVQDGVDCDVHLPTIFSFACISLTISVFGAFVCLISLYLTGHKKTKGSYGKHIKIIVFLLSFLSNIFQSCLKIYDTEMSVVGSSPGSAIGYFLTNWLICLGYSYFIEELLTFLHKSCKFIEDGNSSIGLDTKLNFIKRFSNVPPTAAFSLSIFIILTEADPSKSDLYVIGFLGAQIITYSLYFLMVLSILPLFIQEMNKLIIARPDALENIRIKEIHYEISIAQRMIKVSFFSVAPPLLLFISWNFMRRKFTYLLWLTLISAYAGISVICISFIPNSRRVGPTQSVPILNPASRFSAGFLAVVTSTKAGRK